MKGLTVAIIAALFFVVWTVMFWFGNKGFASVYSKLATAHQLSDLRDKIDEQQRLLEEIKRELEEMKQKLG